LQREHWTLTDTVAGNILFARWDLDTVLSDGDLAVVVEREELSVDNEAQSVVLANVLIGNDFHVYPPLQLSDRRAGIGQQSDVRHDPRPNRDAGLSDICRIVNGEQGPHAPARLLASVGTAAAAADNHDAAVGRDGICHQVPVGCAKRCMSFVTAAV
jgi:hypothetical protein